MKNEPTKELLIQAMVGAGLITRFDQIFRFYPRSKAAKTIGRNSNRMKEIIKAPGELDIEHILMMADLWHISPDDLVRLIFNQMAADDRYAVYDSVKLLVSP